MRCAVVSLNVCCLASGLTNARLPQIVVAGPLLALLGAWWLFGPWALLCGLPLGFALGSQLGRLLGLLLALPPLRLDDRKRERLRDLARSPLLEADVVCVQELYAARPGQLDAGYPQEFAALCAKRGLFCARPKATRWPSLCKDSGLMVLSRFPVECVEELAFTPFWIERFAVNRGALYCRLRTPDGPLHVVTCHVCPQMSMLPPLARRLVGAAEDARAKQFAELGAFVARCAPAGPLVVAGDFNADVQFASPRPAPGEALAAATRAMELQGLEDCFAGRWAPTYGYGGAGQPAPPAREALLTTLAQRDPPVQVGEDLCFVRGLKCDQRAVEPLLAPRGRAYSHLSDHWAVRVELRTTEAPRGSGAVRREAGGGAR